MTPNHLANLPIDPDTAEHVTALLRALGGLCTLTGCDRPHVALGLCNMHYLSRYKRAVEAELLAIKNALPPNWKAVA